MVGMTIIDRLLLRIDVEHKSAEAGFQRLQKAMLSVGLSFLFTGMAIKRFFETILKSMFQTFLMVEGESGAVNNQVGDLMASLAFLKFSLIDAFVNSGLLQVWIDRIQKLVDWFTSLDEETQSNITNFMIWGAIIGTVLMVVGQLALGLLGVISLLEFIGGLGIFAGLVKWLSKVASTLSAATLPMMASLLAGLFAIFILLPKLISRFGGFGNFAKAVLAGIAKVAVLLGGLLMNGILVVLESLLVVAANLTSFLPGGGGGLTSAISDAALAVSSARQAGQGNMTQALNDIQKSVDPIAQQMTVNNNINIEGNADEGVIDSILSAIEEKMGFFNGSTTS